MTENYITCDVIQDLLPLYADECCSEQSKKIVEEHLAACEECQKKQRQFQDSLPEAKTENEKGNEAKIEVKGIRQGIRNINRWKIRGIVSLCLALIFVFAVLPIWNYAHGSGLTYTNLKAAYTAAAFEKALVAGDYEKAYRYLDISSHYDNLLATDTDALIYSDNEENAKAIEKGIRQIEENGFDWYNEICKEKFLENMKTLEDMGEALSSYSGFHIDRQPFGHCVFFTVKTESNTGLRMAINITSSGISEFYCSSLFAAYDKTSEKYLQTEEMMKKTLMLDRLYRSPSINETVMKILYDDTDYDWTKLFIY